MIRYFSLCLFLLSLVLCSCAQLDQYPNSEYNTQIDNKKKIQELLTGAYPRASYFRFLELRTDNVAERGSKLEASMLNEAMFYWREYAEEGIDSPLNYWFDCFRGIAQANAALEALAKFSNKNDAHLRALYGEAFLLRAYYHFMLANIWAPPYQGPLVSKQIAAIPYVERSEQNAFKSYQQLSLQEVYEKIERDLRYGLSLVDDRFYDQPKFHFNKKAAYAFAVRFFSYVGKWKEVVEYSNFPLGGNPVKSLLAYSQWEGQNEMERIRLYSSEYQENNLLITTVESLWQTNYKSDRYGLDFSLKEKIFDRNGVSTLRQIQGYVSGVKRDENRIAYYPKFNEFYSQEGLVSQTRGHYTYNVLFTTEEVLLHRMVAHAMLEEYNQALNDFVIFSTAKHISKGGVGNIEGHEGIELINLKDRDKIRPFYAPLEGKQASILFVASEILRQQFIHEGLRWFDLRRYNMSVNRNNFGGTARIDYILKAEDDRKTLPLPHQAKLIPFKSE